MMLEWTFLQGILVEGYHVASGPSKDYPYGALDRQRPFSRHAVWTLDSYFNGTLNIDIHPLIFKLIKPEFTFRHVEWTDLHPPEDFSFSRCRAVTYQGIEYEGWMYYPASGNETAQFSEPFVTGSD